MFCKEIIVVLQKWFSSYAARILEIASSARLSSENCQLGSARLAKIQLGLITTIDLLLLLCKGSVLELFH